jgi:prevent-host-death family protein
MRRLSVVELRRGLADTLNRAEYQGERVVIHRRDRDAAAIVPIEDLRLLERLIRAEEDRLDAAAADAARAESNDRIPYGALRRELGIEPHEPRGSAVPDRGHTGRGPRPRRPAKKRA